MLKILFQKFVLPVVFPIIAIILLFNVNGLVGFLGLMIYLIIVTIIGLQNIYASLATLSYNKKDFSKTLHWYEKIYKMDKPKVRNLISYGYILLKTGDTEKTQEVFNRVFSQSLSTENKNHAESIMALLYWKQGNLDKAIKTLEDIIKEHETSSIYGSLGYLYIVKGDLRKALKFNLNAYDYNNSNAIILDNLAQNYLLLGDIGNAGKILKELMPKNPTFPEAYYNYALYQKEVGMHDEALGSLEKALEFTTSYLSAVTKDDIDSLIEEIKLIKTNEV